MAIDFPNSPSLNQTFTVGQVTWKWDGSSWKSTSLEEIQYLQGVTSSVQTQLDGKQALVSGVSSTEIGYLDGVTSAIQTQINGKANTSHTHAIADVTNLSTTLSGKADLSGASFTGNISTTGTISGTAATATTSTAATGVGYMGIAPSTAATTGAYTIVAGDAGEHIYTTSSRTVTIPANSAVAFPIGTTIVFISGVGATTTIAITSDTLVQAGTGTTGSRTLAAHGMATIVKVDPTTWYISGNGLS